MLGAGSLAGFLAGLFGIGGGLVVVPALLFIFSKLGLDPENTVRLAVGTSLSTVMVTTFIATQAHAKKNCVDFNLLKSYALPTIFGSIFGVLAGSQLKASTVVLLFSIFLFLLSFKFIFPKALDRIHLNEKIQENILVKYFLGLILGSCSSLFGIGGGSLVITTMTLFKRPILQSIGTASAFGIIISAVGSISSILVGWGADGLPYGSIGYVNFLGFIGIVSGSIFSAPLGVKVSHSLNQVLLKRIFGLYLIFTSIKLFTSVF